MRPCKPIVLSKRSRYQCALRMRLKLHARQNSIERSALAYFGLTDETYTFALYVARVTLDLARA
jgi:hypothetical protein